MVVLTCSVRGTLWWRNEKINDAVAIASQHFPRTTEPTNKSRKLNKEKKEDQKQGVKYEGEESNYNINANMKK